MADAPTYSLVTAAGETIKSSKDYNGKGTATYANGDSYDGNFVGGIRVAKGGNTATYTYHNPAPVGEDGTQPVKEVYTGEWDNNNKHGIGQ